MSNQTDNKSVQQDVPVWYHDSVTMQQRDEIIFDLLCDRYFATSSSVLVGLTGVEKNVLEHARMMQRNLTEESTKRIWYGLKSAFGFRADDMQHAHVIAQLSKQMMDDADARSAREQDGLTERWIASCLRLECPAKAGDAFPDWWMEMRQLFTNAPLCYLNTLAAFYLRQKGLYGINPRWKTKISASYGLVEREKSPRGCPEEEKRATKVWYNFKESKENVEVLKKEFRKLAEVLKQSFPLMDYFEAYQQMLDVLLQRVPFSTALFVQFGGFLLRSAIDPYAFAQFNQMGAVLGLGALSWWYASGTQPADEGARVWAVLEPVIEADGRRTPTGYVWMEFEVEPRAGGGSDLRLCRLHQPTIDEWRKQLRCNTFTDSAVPSYLEYHYEMSEDMLRLKLQLQERASKGEAQTAEPSLPELLCRIETDEMWSRVVRQSEDDVLKDSRQTLNAIGNGSKEQVIKQRLLELKLGKFFEFNGWQPLRPEELTVTDVVIGRNGLQIHVDGTFFTDKLLNVDWEVDEHLKQVHPSDEIIPFKIEREPTPTEAGSRKVGYYWPKVDFAITQTLAVPENWQKPLPKPKKKKE